MLLHPKTVAYCFCRYSGISRTCGVNLNRTHVLIVGGRYGIFDIEDQRAAFEGSVGVGDAGFKPTSSETIYSKWVPYRCGIIHSMGSC